MKTLLNRGRKTATVAIEGENLTIRELSFAQVEGLRDDSDPTTPLKLIIASVVEPAGNHSELLIPSYADADLPALRESLTIAITKKLVDAIKALNGLGGDSPGPKA